MKAEPMALLEIFGLLKDSAVPVAGEEGKGLRRVYTFSNKEENALTSPTPVLLSTKVKSL